LRFRSRNLAISASHCRLCGRTATCAREQTTAARRVSLARCKKAVGLDARDDTIRVKDQPCIWLLPPEIPESLAGKDRNAKSGSEATREKHEQLKTKALSTIQRIEQSCTVSLA
ncbi:hypothetical protein HaLaN_23837, partial [Haematococcus lacustris]